MGLYGNIDTMSVPELFGWVDSGRKSGTLEVERDKISKRIMFRDGRVVGCSSNEPTTLMGQFLLSRGKITREVLSEAMRRHAESEATLGETLVTMGAISPADQEAFVANKIEETILGLFDWSDAVFRFYADALPDPNSLPVDLQIREVLERGVRRRDEGIRSQEAITDPGMVLRRTEGGELPELAGHLVAGRIYDLIDGRKTVAEILLHSHAPEFLVTKFLTVLLQAQVVEIVEIVAAAVPEPEPVESDEWIEQAVAPLQSTADAVGPAPVSPYAEMETDAPPLDMQELEPEIESLMAAADQVDHEIVFEVPQAPTLDLPEEADVAAAEQATPDATASPRSSGFDRNENEDSRELQEEINVALQLMSSGQPEAALELLNAMAVAHPGDVSLGKLVSNAERDYLQKMLAGELHASRIPTRTQVAESNPDEKMTADESFLLEQVDGITDIQALLWVTPLRDVEVLKTLSRLLRKGYIDVRQAA
jgi:hypothetical protein